ncbi:MULTISPECIES: hypothetical protein [Streptomyces]|uniref:hypothetical protein n=1 Tax=Streptomyces TaxID=1883 RepID=UPI0004AABC3F|nr:MULTISPECIES: hypothetical protein [Streptomyces]QXQ96992.1 hypothetical protein KV381_11870 [Streptomyces sp. WY228]WKN14837.1 hypothetical protein NEH83_11800 [Streptomyces sp. JUS-F4]
MPVRTSTQIEIWFGTLPRQSIRRVMFSNVNVLIKQIREYINSWNENANPFTWAAAADEVQAKVRIVEVNAKKLVSNNSDWREQDRDQEGTQVGNSPIQVRSRRCLGR